MIEGQPDLPKLGPQERGKVVDVSHRLGTPNLPPPEWLLPTPLDKIPKLEREAFPPPPKNEDGSFSYPKHAMDSEENNVRLTPNIASASPTILRKRGYEQQNGVEMSVPPKRRNLSGGGVIKQADMFHVSALVRSSIPNTPVNVTANPLNGRAKVATITRVGGRKQLISWVDAPDDVYFVATDSTKKLRKQITVPELRRSARKPCRKINIKTYPFYYDNPPVIPPAVNAPVPAIAANTPPESLAVVD